MASINDKERLAVIETTLEAMKEDMEKLTTSVQTMTELLQQGKGVRTFIGWVVGVSAAIGTAVITIKEVFHIN